MERASSRVMIRRLRSPLAIALILGGLAQPGHAVVVPGGEGAFRTICLDSGSSKHPKKIETAVAIPDERFLQGAQLLALYEPEPSRFGDRGKLTARISVRHASGGTTSLGKATARVQTPAQPVVAAKATDVPLLPGDTVEFRFTFKNFDRLTGDECFTLFTLIEPPSPAEVGD